MSLAVDTAIRPVIIEKGSETSAILQAIAALAAGLTARDRQLSALSEQIRVGLGGPSVSNPTGISLHETLSSIVRRMSDLEAKIDKNEGHRVGTVGYQNMWCHEMKDEIKRLSAQLQHNQQLSSKSAKKRKRR